MDIADAYYRSRESSLGVSTAVGSVGVVSFSFLNAVCIPPIYVDIGFSGSSLFSALSGQKTDPVLVMLCI